MSEFQGNGDSEQTSRCIGIERHYILPGNWLTKDYDTQRRTVMSDGTLLSPLNGDVIVMQSASLRRAIGLSS
jgi:hypothetical protein